MIQENIFLSKLGFGYETGVVWSFIGDDLSNKQNYYSFLEKIQTFNLKTENGKFCSIYDYLSDSLSDECEFVVWPMVAEENGSTIFCFGVYDRDLNEFLGEEILHSDFIDAYGDAVFTFTYISQV